MSAFISVSLSLMCLLTCSCTAQEKISADLGQNKVILPCEVSNNNINIIAVEWIRPDQDPDYVLFYRDGRLDPHNQHPSYQNRVDLQDKDMKDGDASMILKNVTKNDIGRYECCVFVEGRKDLISNITLEVHVPGEKFEGDKDGGSNVGVIVGSVVGVILLLAVLASVGFWFCRRRRRQNQHLPVPPDEPTDTVTDPEHHQNQVQLV